jgi:pimeloyl-ACP methyl ester carboxylesterase
VRVGPRTHRDRAARSSGRAAGEPLLWITGFAISSEIFSPVIDTYADAVRLRPLRQPRRRALPRTVAHHLDPGARRATPSGCLDALGIDSAHVYGLSMGGMVGAGGGDPVPDRVRGLVLGCTTHGGPAGVCPRPGSPRP